MDFYPKACDIWAAGCCLYYLLTGDVLFNSKSKEDLQIEQNNLE